MDILGVPPNNVIRDLLASGRCVRFYNNSGYILGISKN